MIDPKGDRGSFDRLVRLATKIDPKVKDRFRFFSLSEPGESASYNPLKHGSAVEKKDRILEALNWSEPFYQAMAGSFLSALLSAVEITSTDIDLDYLEKILLQKTIQSDLLRKLVELGKAGNHRASQLFATLETFFEKRRDDLLGLHAQISILNHSSIRHLLSSTTAGDNQRIDLHEVLRGNQIAYFQLGTLANADTARRLGRMIIEDAKSLAHSVYRTTAEAQRKFFPIFIDEFGSFASKEFIEFLKQSRGAKFGIHMFCQGLEDLDVISSEFRRQATSNPMTTIALRVVDNETVNEIASLAGTVDALEQSYQVSGEIVSARTGMGNLRETKQMRVEHDVLRNLDNLQAVLIKKSPSQVSGFQIYFPEQLL